MSPSRRTFLRAGAVATGVLAAGPLRALEALAAEPLEDGGPVEALAAGYGPLRAAGAHLELPDGFWYVRFGAAGDKMSNGKPTPNYHDGMAAFPGPGGTVRLVRNHEVDGQKGAFANDPYDGVAGGGTTNLVFDPKAARLRGELPVAGRDRPQLRRGRHALGVVDHLRGDHRRPRRTATTHAARLLLRGAGRGGRAGQGSPARGHGPLHPRGGVRRSGLRHRLRDGGPAPPPASTASCPRRRGCSPQAGGCRCWPSPGGRRPTSAGASIPVRGCRSPGSTSPIPTIATPVTTRRRCSNRGSGGAGPPSDGSRAASGTPTARGAAPGSSPPTAATPASVRCGGTTRPTAGSSSSTSRARPVALRQPDNVTVSPRGALLLCEDGQGSRTASRGCPTADLFDFARNRGSDGEFAGATWSPDGKLAVRQHPAAGGDLRHHRPLGPRPPLARSFWVRRSLSVRSSCSSPFTVCRSGSSTQPDEPGLPFGLRFRLGAATAAASLALGAGGFLVGGAFGDGDFRVAWPSLAWGPHRAGRRTCRGRACPAPPAGGGRARCPAERGLSRRCGPARDVEVVP